jgi:hypothetical protein
MPDYGDLPGHKCNMMAQGKIRLFPQRDIQATEIQWIY